MRRLLWFCSITMLFCMRVSAQSLVLLNGTIIDGAGGPHVTGNLRIQNGEIKDIGAFKPLADETTINVSGLIVAPGFIDLHSPSDASRIALGVTTIVLGHEGAGPIAVEEFMKRFDEAPPIANVATFVGHGAIRVREMSDWKATATPADMQKLSNDLEIAMREGAFGLSAALDREPGKFAAIDELAALSTLVGRYGGFFTTVLRSTTVKVVDAVKEVIDLARRSKSPVHISGISGTTATIAPLVDQARAQGLDITADVSIKDPNARDFLRHNWVMVAGEDAFPGTLDILPVESAIRKMAALPASRLSLKQRGILKKGAIADVVVFGPPAHTMKYVFVNGIMVISDGRPTDAKPGRGLR